MTSCVRGLSFVVFGGIVLGRGWTVPCVRIGNLTVIIQLLGQITNVVTSAAIHKLGGLLVEIIGLGN